jgi:hypothetical protein
MSGEKSEWCRRGESNPRPRDYETLALPLSYAGKTGNSPWYEGRQESVKTCKLGAGVWKGC